MVTLNSSHNESIIFGLLNDYLTANPKIGYLNFTVYQDSPIEGLIPIPNALITVSKSLGEGFFISKVIMSDMNGATESIPLPTVDKGLTQIPNDGDAGPVYAMYNARVEAPGYKTADYFDIHIFEGVTTFQRANLNPVKGIWDQI